MEHSVWSLNFASLEYSMCNVTHIHLLLHKYVHIHTYVYDSLEHETTIFMFRVNQSELYPSHSMHTCHVALEPWSAVYISPLETILATTSAFYIYHFGATAFCGTSAR